MVDGQPPMFVAETFGFLAQATIFSWNPKIVIFKGKTYLIFHIFVVVKFRTVYSRQSDCHTLYISV